MLEKTQSCIGANLFYYNFEGTLLSSSDPNFDVEMAIKCEIDAFRADFECVHIDDMKEIAIPVNGCILMNIG